MFNVPIRTMWKQGWLQEEISWFYAQNWDYIKKQIHPIKLEEFNKIRVKKLGLKPLSLNHLKKRMEMLYEN